MIVKQNLETYPFPTMFLLGSRKFAGNDQRLGALLAKQTGTSGNWASAEIRMKDKLYIVGNFNTIWLESDTVAYKPSLDLLVVGGHLKIGQRFGKVQVTRGAVVGAPIDLIYGWRARSSDNRKSDAGEIDPGEFVPDVNVPWKLPNGFRNSFFNGSPIVSGSRLQTGDQVTYIKPIPPDPDLATTVVIPAAPQLRFNQNGREIPSPTFTSRGVDTVVYDEPVGKFLLTWRFVFVWEDRFELVTLEVS